MKKVYVLTRRAVMRSFFDDATQSVVVVADSSKIGKTAHFVSLKLPEVRVLVTDDGADPAEIAAYRANGVETLVVSTGAVSGNRIGAG